MASSAGRGSPSGCLYARLPERQRLVPSGGQQVAVGEPVLAPYDLAAHDGDRAGEDRSAVHEGVELTILAAGIRRRGELIQQRTVERAAGESRFDLRLVHAHQRRLETVGDERLGERARRALPERIEPMIRRAGEQAVAIVSHVVQIQIAEGDVSHRGVARGEHRERVDERSLVRFVRRLRLERDLDERQAERSCLRFEKRAPHAVDAHPIVLSGDAREQRHHLVLVARAKVLERERAVLPAAPAQGDRGTRHWRSPEREDRNLFAALVSREVQRGEPYGRRFLCAARALLAGTLGNRWPHSTYGTRIALRALVTARWLEIAFSSERPMAKDRVYETEDGMRIAPLSALNDFEVAEGYPDIRGWRVDSADGQHVGKVHDLLIDVDNMRTRYLDVRLTKELAASPGDRDVLVPIGTAQVVDGKDVVRVPLTAERFGLLPLYDHGRLTRTHELEVRRHFSLGEAAAAAATGATAGATRGFYDDDGYDDRRFFGARRPRTDAEIAARRVDSERELAARERAERDLVAREHTERDLVDRERVDRAVAHRDAGARDEEIRVPVDRDDAVLLKRGDDGRDEIIIRRPLGARDERRR